MRHTRHICVKPEPQIKRVPAGTLLMLCAILLALLFPLFAAPARAEAEEAEEPLTQEKKLKSLESWTHSVNVLGRDYLFFAQNSPEWARMYTMTDEDLLFGDAACMVTSLANALVNTVPFPMLPDILNVTKSPIRVDTRSCVAARPGVRQEERFTITTEVDFLRYFPLVINNYASGNNIHHVSNPHLMGFFPKLLDTYQTVWEGKITLGDAVTALEADMGAVVIVSSGGQGSVMTENGHFFVAVGCRDRYMYFLDSYVRDRYPRDTGHIIEILEPGVIRVKYEDLHRMPIMFKYIIYKDEFAYPYTQDRWEEIVWASDHPR